MTRKKGNKDYTTREKQMMVSLINDYSLFGATDDEMIKMLSAKIGKEYNEKISETLFYRLKKEAKVKRGESEQWLDHYTRFQFVEFYRKRMEELELVQKKLLKALIKETEKLENEQNKSIINQLSKTISENSKVLAEFGIAPPMMYKILDLASMNYSAKTNHESKEVRKIKLLQQNVKSGIYFTLDNENQNDNKEKSLTEEYDPNRVF